MLNNPRLRLVLPTLLVISGLTGAVVLSLGASITGRSLFALQFGFAVACFTVAFTKICKAWQGVLLNFMLQVGTLLLAYFLRAESLFSLCMVAVLWVLAITECLGTLAMNVPKAGVNEKPGVTKIDD